MSSSPQTSIGKRLRVMTVLGTRPEIVRLSCVIRNLDRYTDHYLVHTGQNYDYELSEIFFKRLSIRSPDRNLESAGSSPVQTISNLLEKIDPVLEEIRPDAFLVLGDTNSCLSAYAAKRRRIPVFHMEAGNRCYDQRVPEEINRRIIDHLADVNLPYSEPSRQNLIAEGFAADRIIKTGSPMKEVLDSQIQAVSASKILSELSLAPQEYYVASIHREENVDSVEKFKELVSILNRVSKHHNRKVVFSCHPRTLKKLKEVGEILNPLVIVSKPFDYVDYLRLQQSATAVLSDSGTITEESSILNFPALNIRETHERREGMDEASVMFTGLNVERVMQALSVLEKQHRGKERLLKIPEDYNVANVSEKVVRIILSYTDYVKRTVWGE